MITINGQEFDFEPGQTVLEAATGAGVYIPTLCAHSSLPPFGACRLCLVKIEKMRGFPPACTTPAADGMVITTEDGELHELRRGIMELILIEHPHACIVCNEKVECQKLKGGSDKAGRVTGCSMCPKRPECEIREVCDHLGLEDAEIPMEYKNIPLEREDPFFDRDYNLCILCGRCVRVCQEVRGAGAIALTNRSHNTRIGTMFGRTHLDGPCRFCGACIDVCPTGSLSARGSKWHGDPDSRTESVCGFCPVNCSMSLEEKWGRVMAAVPDPERGSTRGQACMYGRFCIPAFVNGAERLRYPMVRRDGKLTPVSWEDAFDFIRDSISGFAPGDVGFLVSPFLTSESAYLTGRFARDIVGTDNIDILSPFGRIVMDHRKKSGEAAWRWTTLDDVEGADWLLLLNSDISYSHPVMTVAIHEARKRGARLAVVDDRENDFDRCADISIRVKPGSLGSFLTSLQASLRETPETSDASGREIKDLADILKSSGNGIILAGSRIMSNPGPDRIMDGIRDLLALLEVENGFMPLLEESNTIGVCEALPGKGRMDMMEEIAKGNLKALFLSDASLTPESISKVEFLVLSGIFPSDLNDAANVILPSAAFTEESGHFISLEGCETELRKAADPQGMAIPEWKIVAGLARAMGGEGFTYDSSQDIHREMSDISHLPCDTGRSTIPVKVEYSSQPLKYRGTPVHEIVEDLRIYLEAKRYIPGTDTTAQGEGNGEEQGGNDHGKPGEKHEKRNASAAAARRVNE